MKGIIILTAAFVIGLSPINGESNESIPGPVPAIPLSLNGSDWGRINPGTWDAKGLDGKSTSYRIDKNSDGALQVYYSTDGFKWELKNDRVWMDNEGNYFRAIHNTVAFSDDGGISWTELKHCVWKDSDGRWLMLDAECRLWKMKDKEWMEEKSN